MKMKRPFRGRNEAEGLSNLSSEDIAGKPELGASYFGMGVHKQQ